MHTKKYNYAISGTKTVSYELGSIRYLGSNIWKLIIPDVLKESLELFKEKVKGFKFENCPCKLM